MQNIGHNLLKDKRSLITGAGKGIGRAIASAFASNGSDVALVSRTASDIEKLASELHTAYGVRAIPYAGDMSNLLDAKTIVENVEKVFGWIDIIVCAAGYPMIKELWERKIHELQDEDFLKVFEVDFLGSLRVARSALPLMMKRKSGVIILFSSTPAIAGYYKGGPYTVAKAANLGLAKELASEYGSYNIRTYAIAPGNIRTPATFDKLSPEEQEALSLEAPLKRWGDPQEVANVAVALASNYMSFVTGQTIVVDGGTVML
jgi:3-oxoacyl-[acyl-carrier protein] reductase